MGDADRVRKEVEIEIAHHTRAITDLKTRWNSVSPICRMPTELLVEIFVHHARDIGSRAVAIYRGSTSQPRGEKLYAWTSVAHICRHWRAVALASPRLWSHLYITSPRWTTELLRRTEKVLLVVFADVPGYEPERRVRLEALRLVLKEMERIEILKLSLHASQLRDLQGELTEATDSLKTLEFFIRGSNGNVAFVDALFQAKHPRLQRLALSAPSIQWSNPPLCPNLTELFLSSTSLQAGVTLSSAFDALQSMPQLQTLTLRDLLRQEVDSSPTCSVVSLPRLKILKLSGKTFSPTVGATFLSHLYLPSISNIYLTCTPIDRAAQLVSPLCAILHNFATITALSLRVDESNIIVRAWTNRSPSENPAVRMVTSDCDIRLTISGGDTHRVSAGLLTALCGAFKPLDITALRVKLRHFSQKQLETLLTPMRNVVLMEVVGSPPVILPKVLQPVVTAPDRGPDDFPLPRLHTIWFRQSSFIARPEKNLYPMQVWLDCLDFRRISGAPVQEVVFDDCTVDPCGDENKLAGAVQRLVVYD
ncbi:hypothetical protein OBBRIDRAFT_748746 [Obba rivulosa]|uniref:F-box domain-containing protein n=1 Tax=Obba rivulosa TaxID=1052685 RepID=A0A8E2J385_9APHY|nr:hypothetical protein OBBRIDRAFT_748746 [Obba rivulosa]